MRLLISLCSLTLPMSSASYYMSSTYLIANYLYAHIYKSYRLPSPYVSIPRPSRDHYGRLRHVSFLSFSLPFPSFAPSYSGICLYSLEGWYPSSLSSSPSISAGSYPAIHSWQFCRMASGYLRRLLPRMPCGYVRWTGERVNTLFLKYTHACVWVYIVGCSGVQGVHLDLVGIWVYQGSVEGRNF